MVMTCELLTGIEQRDGKRHGRMCRVMSGSCPTHPADNGSGTACSTRRRKRRRKKLRRKRKAPEETVPILHHPFEEEDWEKEIKESSPTEVWDNETYNSCYDPEDAICSGVLQMTLNPDPHGSHHAHYSPAVHHVSPVKWVQRVPHVVVGQFIDAEE